MSLSIGPTFLSNAQAILGLRETQQSLISSNLANADTPGYKALAINFQSDLQSALAGHTSSLARPKVMYETSAPVALNGNDVSPAMQKLASIENSDGISSETTFLHQSTNDLITAMRPNPNGI